jgi:archaellin
MAQDTNLDTLTARDRESGSIGIGAMIVFIALILVAAVASTIIIKTAEELQQNAESTSQDTRDQISGKISISDIYVKTTADPLGGGAGDTDVATFDVIARVSSGSLNVQEGDITWYITCKVTYTTDGTTTFAVVDTELADARDLSDNEGIAEADILAGNQYTIASQGTVTDGGMDTIFGTTGVDYDVGVGGTVADATTVGDSVMDEDAYLSGDELTAGTTFRFEIDLGVTDSAVDGDIDADDFGATDKSTPVPGCDAEAGAGSELGLRIVVNGGGETLAKLKIQSITLGKSVM